MARLFYPSRAILPSLSLVTLRIPPCTFCYTSNKSKLRESKREMALISEFFSIDKMEIFWPYFVYTFYTYFYSFIRRIYIFIHIFFILRFKNKYQTDKYIKFSNLIRDNIIRKKNLISVMNIRIISQYRKIYISIKFLFISKKNRKKISNAISLSILYSPVIIKEKKILKNIDYIRKI